MSTRILKGVEIFTAGEQTDSSGVTTEFTNADLDHMIEVFEAGAPEYVPVKIGHTSDEFNRQIAAEMGLPPSALKGENGGQDGVLALGRVVALRRIQNKLVSDFEVAESLADMVQKGALRDVSVEMVGEPGNFTLTAVAWLGAELPAVDDLNGLAAAAQLKRQAQPAMSFKRSVTDVRIEGVLDESAISRIADRVRKVFQREHKENDMSILDKIRGIRGFEKATEDDILKKFQEDSEEEEEGGEEEEVTASPFDGATTAAIKAILGVGMEASGDEVLDALRSMLALPDNSAPEDIGAELMKRVNTPVQKFSESREYREMSREIDNLKRRDRIAHFKSETLPLGAVQGTPDELAERLVEIEERDPKLATQMLESWQETQKYAEKSGVLESLGHNGTPAEKHEWEERVEEYAREKELTFHKAQVELARSDPKAFAQYREEKLTA